MKKLFGTDGMRGEAGRFPLDAQTVRTIGRSLARHLAEQVGHAPRILLGRDTRESGEGIERAFVDGAQEAGAVCQSAGVITTPGVAYLTRTLPADAGVVISASHNPYQDNGIKIFAPTGRKLNDATDVSLSYDASSYKPGERVVQLSPGNITLQLPDGVTSEGVTIERIEPGGVPLRLEPRVERTLEVEPRLEGKLPEGYELFGAQTLPARVRVRGPESHVNALAKAPTETILLGDRRESFTATQIAIDIEDRKLVALDTVVDVIVKIGETQATKRLSDVAARTADGARQTRLTIEVRGARSVIESLRAADLTVVLETAADGTSTPRLVLPPNLGGRIELVSTSPAN